MAIDPPEDGHRSPQAKLSESVTDGSLDHLIHPTPLSHEFRFGIRELLLLMFLVAVCAAMIGFAWRVLRNTW